MPAIVTKQFRVRNAKEFINKLLPANAGGSSAYDGVNYIYLAFGKVVPWDETNFGSDDTNPPSPDGDNDDMSNIYRDGLAASPIDESDTRLGVRRYNWISGVVYSQYDDQDPAVNDGTSEYFVYVEATGDIFKCLDNNSGAPSSVRPVKPGPSLLRESFVLSDGYRWKFMVQTSTDSRFLTTNFAPIRTLNVHPSASVPAGFADQHVVQQLANTGTIEAFVTTSGGAGYTKHSGTFTIKTIATGASGTSFTLTSDTELDALLDDSLNGAAIYVSDGAGQEGRGTIKDYVQSSRTVTLEPTTPLPFTPGSGNIYHIGPTIAISGDGQGSNAYSIISASGSLSKVKSITTGNSYTYATVTVDAAAASTGSGASVRAIIPPNGGHGKDPANELNGYNVLLNKTIDGAGTANSYPVTNDYRVVSLIRNPLLSNGYNQDVLVPATTGANWFANTDQVHMSTWLECNTSADVTMQDFSQWNSGSGPLPDDEILGVNSGAKGRVVEFNSDARGILNITNVVANTTGGTFLPTEAVQLTRTYNGFVPSGNNFLAANGFSVGFVADPLFDVLQVGELQPGTGEVLYIENRTPILRSVDQRETVTIVIEF